MFQAGLIKYLEVSVTENQANRSFLPLNHFENTAIPVECWKTDKHLMNMNEKAPTDQAEYRHGTTTLRRVAFITNPTAGKGRGRKTARLAREHLRARGLELAEFPADTPAAVIESTRAASTDPAIDAIVSCGGDGMLSLVLQAQVGSGKPLGVIPSGTGNDHARHYGIPLDPRGAAEVIAAGHWQETDLGLATFNTPPALNNTFLGSPAAGQGQRPANNHGSKPDDNPTQTQQRWFSTIACVGFDQLVNEKTTEISWPKGSLRYMLALLIIISQFRPYPVRVSIDDRELPYRELSLIAVANTSSYGGGTRIAPQASTRDGRFAVTALPAMARRRAIRLLAGLKFGDITGDSRFIFDTGQRVVVQMGDLTPIADGEPLGSGQVTLEVRPRAGLFLVAPPGS